jgi:hypothetical protein
MTAIRRWFSRLVVGSIFAGAVAVSSEAATNVAGWQATRRSEHQTEWSSVRYSTNPATGPVRATTDSYIEISTGLNRIDPTTRQWQPSDPSFRITATGAEANLAGHSVRISGNINSAGAVIIERDGLRTGSDHMLDKLLTGEISGLDAADYLATYEDWITTVGSKGLRTTEVWDGSIIDPAPGPLRGHHVVTKNIQKQLEDLLPGRSFDYDKSPVKVLLTDPEHAGSGPGSLHNKMSTFDNGELTPLGVENFDDAGDLMNELIDFYNSEPDYQALAEATRAWCRKYNVPFSH